MKNDEKLTAIRLTVQIASLRIHSVYLIRV